MYFVYSLLLALAGVVALPYFLVQGLRHGKYLGSFRARLGQVPPAAQTPGGAIWLHAVSVGEVLACQRLVAAIKEAFPGRPLVVSTTTETGFATASKRLAADAVFFCPFDFRFAVRRVLAQVRPALLLVAETEFWPNLFRETEQFGARVVVVNARISDRSFPRYRAFRFFFRQVLRRTSLLLAQSEEDARRLVAIGAPPERIEAAGNLKYDQPLPPPPAAWLDRAMREWTGDQCILAGSTAAGEEEPLLDDFARLRVERPRLKMIVAPRRPERFDEVAGLAAARGFTVARRSALTAGSTAIEPGASILVLDSIGELASFYRYAAVAFVGGSLVPHGGQNPLEAAQYGRPVVVGPHTSNFRDITRALRDAGALRQISGPSELCEALRRVLDDASVARAMGEAGRRLLEASRGATARTVERLVGLVDEASLAGAARPTPESATAARPASPAAGPVRGGSP